MYIIYVFRKMKVSLVFVHLCVHTPTRVCLCVSLCVDVNCLYLCDTYISHSIFYILNAILYMYVHSQEYENIFGM